MYRKDGYAKTPTAGRSPKMFGVAGQSPPIVEGSSISVTGNVEQRVGQMANRLAVKQQPTADETVLIMCPQPIHVPGMQLVPIPSKGCPTNELFEQETNDMEPAGKRQKMEVEPETEERFACVADGCGKTYSRSDGAREHMRIVHGMVNLHFCDIADCKAVFPNFWSLTYHKAEVHEGRTMCGCITCGNKYRTQKTLHAHYSKKKHGTVPSRKRPYKLPMLVPTVKECEKEPIAKEHLDNVVIAEKSHHNFESPNNTSVGNDIEISLVETFEKLEGEGIATTEFPAGLHPDECSFDGQLDGSTNFDDENLQHFEEISVSNDITVGSTVEVSSTELSGQYCVGAEYLPSTNSQYSYAPVSKRNGNKNRPMSVMLEDNAYEKDIHFDDPHERRHSFDVTAIVPQRKVLQAGSVQQIMDAAAECTKSMQYLSHYQKKAQQDNENLMNILIKSFQENNLNK